MKQSPCSQIAVLRAELHASRQELDRHQRFTNVLLETIEVLGAVSTLTDVTAKRESLRARAEERQQLLELERAAHAASAFFNAVLDSSPDDTYVVDLSNWDLVYTSGGDQILPHATGGLRERLDRLRAVVDEDDIARVASATTSVADLADGEVVELRYRVGDHDVGRWISHRLTPFNRNGQGVVTQALAVVRDVTSVVDAEDRLAETDRTRRVAESRFRNVFEQAGVGAVIVGLDGLPTHVNAAACELMGRPPELLIGHLWSQYLAPDQVSTADLVASNLGAGRDTFRAERRYLRPDGSVVWTSGFITMVRDEQGEPDYLLAQLGDITERKRIEADLDRQALHDPLTGLPNRFLFAERVRQALTDPSIEPVTVLVFLIEGLHAIVDSEGYLTGDLVLKEIASRLAGALGDLTVANLQPGRFGVLTTGAASDSILAAEQALATVDAPIDLPHGRVRVRAKVGICAAPPDRGDPEAVVGRLIQDAAAAAGRSDAGALNCIAFASPELRRVQENQRRIELLLRGALDNDLVRVAYQPVVDLSTGLLVGAEALLRVSDGMGRPVPPDQVIPVAETSGLIIDIGLRVLHLAASQAARWYAEHGILLPVAVNVSAVQLDRDEFLSEVLDATARVGLPPEALSIELTESVLLDAGSAGVEKLRTLRQAGIHLAIDDFGTGYASLTYLRDLPATTLKIDRSFVGGVPHDRASMTIVSSVIGLAHNFGMTCIAEGIETEDQLAYLTARGVLGQGYLLGRPGAAEAIGDILSRVTTPAPGESLLPQSAARAREAAGDRRDEIADRRDAQADLRDQVAHTRDQVADTRDQAGAPQQAGADERTQAGLERAAAQQDRDLGATERLQAELERNVALADRHSAGTPPTTLPDTAVEGVVR